MELDVARAFREPGTFFPFEATWEASEIEFGGQTLRLITPLRIEGSFVGTETHQVFLRGRLTGQLEAICARCLEKFLWTVDASVEESCAVVDAQLSATTREDLDEEGVWPIVGERVDLAPLLEGNLIVQLPMRFLCREDCRGLCPGCGINRNHQTCSCQADRDNANPFEALQSLMQEGDKEV